MVIVADGRQPQALQLHYEEDPRSVNVFHSLLCLSLVAR